MRQGVGMEKVWRGPWKRQSSARASGLGSRLDSRSARFGDAARHWWPDPRLIVALPGGTYHVKFVVNGEAHHRDQPVRVGVLQVWDIVNDTLMDHPFHLHGFFFQILSVNGAAPAYRLWEDTVNVAPRSRVRIAWMPDDRPGEWMYHCHILEHHASGMMGTFEVVG